MTAQTITPRSRTHLRVVDTASLSTVTVSVKDDDRTLKFSSTSVTVDEGTTATYTVELKTEPSTSVTVSVTRQSGDQNLKISAGSSLTFTTSDWDVVADRDTICGRGYRWQGRNRDNQTHSHGRKLQQCNGKCDRHRIGQ